MVHVDCRQHEWVDQTSRLVFGMMAGVALDGLQLVQTGGPVRASDTYSVGASSGSGISTIVGEWHGWDAARLL